MGRVCYVPSLLWAEFVMCRVDPIPLNQMFNLQEQVELGCMTVDNH